MGGSLTSGTTKILYKITFSYMCKVYVTDNRRLWFTPIILATQEAKIRRITVGSQPWAKSSQALS
jgi:hypothetical protein